MVVAGFQAPWGAAAKRRARRKHAHTRRRRSLQTQKAQQFTSVGILGIPRCCRRPLKCMPQAEIIYLPGAVSADVCMHAQETSPPPVEQRPAPKGAVHGSLAEAVSVVQMDCGVKAEDIKIGPGGGFASKLQLVAAKATRARQSLGQYRNLVIVDDGRCARNRGWHELTIGASVIGAIVATPMPSTISALQRRAGRFWRVRPGGLPCTVWEKLVRRALRRCDLAGAARERQRCCGDAIGWCVCSHQLSASPIARGPSDCGLRPRPLPQRLRAAFQCRLGACGEGVCAEFEERMAALVPARGDRRAITSLVQQPWDRPWGTSGTWRCMTWRLRRWP